MPTEKEVYENHVVEYEALVSREDYQGNILKAIQEIVSLDGLDALDLGAGTGRLACLLAPHVQTMLAFDLSPHMLGIARDKLLAVSSRRIKPDPSTGSPVPAALAQAGQRRWLAAVSDHRFLPLTAHRADLIVSGWSVSYVAVWNPLRWRDEADAWLAEARRVLRPGGAIILFESLGTGNVSPQRLPHLENFYDWLDEKGFQNKWIRTDYKFESPEAASEVAGFFFGDEMKQKIAREQMTILPECTGAWWLKTDSGQ